MNIERVSLAALLLNIKIEFHKRSVWEILKGERGKTWTVEVAFTVITRYGPVTVRRGFVHDRFTIAPDLKYAIIASIVHDWLYIYKTFADGSPCTKRQADQILRDLIRECGEANDVPVLYGAISNIYWVGVTIGGWGWYTSNEDRMAEDEYEDDAEAYIDYVDAVDEILEAKRGETSGQENMNFIASCQEEAISAEDCANDIIAGKGSDDTQA